MESNKYGLDKIYFKKFIAFMKKFRIGEKKYFICKECKVEKYEMYLEERDKFVCMDCFSERLI